MTVVLHAPAKRVGNSLAVFLPAARAREAGIKEGDALTVRIDLDAEEPLGLFKRLGLGRVSSARQDDEMAHDRA